MLTVICRLDRWRNRDREEEDDLSFPDEVDTPKDIPARTRFQRFRGMRSFRTSPWDTYENLPRDYARIFQFEDFKRTERGVRRRAQDDLHVVEVSTLSRTYLHNTYSGIFCTAWCARHGASQRCPRGSCKHPPRCPLLASTARAQGDCSKFHGAAEHGIRWFRPVQSK